jgi:hypothetical protein
MANHDYSYLDSCKNTILRSGILKQYQIVCEWTDRKEAYGEKSFGFMSRSHGQTGDFFMWPLENIHLGENNVPEVIFYRTESGGYKYDWVKTNPENTTDHQTSETFLFLSGAIEHFISKR